MSQLQVVRFGEFLKMNHVITDEQLLDALGDHWANGGRLGEALCRLGYASQSQIEQFAETFHTLEVVDIS